MKPIPDYFIALVKQHANLRSDDEAVRVIRLISDGLDMTIDPKRANYLFSIMPGYLQPSQQKFYVRIMDWQPRFKRVTLVERLKISLQLTDESEVATVFKAYFKAVKIVVSPQARTKLMRALPADLNQIYIKA